MLVLAPPPRYFSQRRKVREGEGDFANTRGASAPRQKNQPATAGHDSFYYPDVSLADLPWDGEPSSNAIASISTRAFLGKVDTPTVERAGGFSAK